MFTTMRAAIALAIAGTVILGSLTAAQPAQAATDADFDAIRAKIYDSLTGGSTYSTSNPILATRLGSLGTTAQGYWSSMDTSSARTYLWSDLPKTSDSADYLQVSFDRLWQMTVALQTRGTSVYDNASLRSDVMSAVNWVYTNWYYHNVPRDGSPNSWFTYELGAAMFLNDITVMLYDYLSPATRLDYTNQIWNQTARITYPGANGAWQAYVLFVRAVLAHDFTRMNDVMTGSYTVSTGTYSLAKLLSFRTPASTWPFEDGFYEDGSMIEHKGFAYSGGYGVGYFQVVAAIVAFTKGTPWEVPSTGVQFLVKVAFESYVPIMFAGGVFYSTTGRLNSWRGPQEQLRGHVIIEAIMQLLQFATPNDALRLKRQIKEWLLSDSPSLAFYNDATIAGILKAASIVDDTSIVRAGDPNIYRQFTTMERPTVQKPGYAFTVATSSSRIGNYESINKENLRGWHTGDGMTYLYTAGDPLQYQNDYWPTVDSHRLPGTTALANSEPAPNSRNSETWVGGTDLRGVYGATGMQLHPSGTTLTAKKSWFMFDDEVVALGADINSTGSTQVETIVDNRQINSAGTSALTVNGTAQSTTLGWSAALSGTSWANLAGPTASSGIGYYFPQGATVQALREARTGTWNDVNQRPGYSDTTPVTKNYVSLAIAHGSAVSGGSYSYVVLPNQDAAQTAAYAANPDIVVLANSSTVQAVRDTTQNMIGANFWTDGIQSISASASMPNYLTVDKKSSVMTQQTGNRLDVSVADPTRTNTGVITVQLNQSASAAFAADSGITITSLSPITFTANVNGLAGRALHVSFTTASSLTDGLDDWSKSVSHTVNWAIDGAGDAAAYFDGDATRAFRTGSNTAQSIVYRLDGMNQFSARVYAIEGFANKVTFSASSDGTNWTTVAASSTTPVNSGGSWYRSDFRPAADLPTGTNFLRVTLLNDGRVYSPQLSVIDIRTSITDNLDDWSQSAAHSSGWTIDGAGDSALYFDNDTSRAFRSGSNAAQTITYKLDGMSTFSARVYAIDGFSGKVAFYASPDNVTYTAVTPSSETPGNSGGSWYRSTFTPSGSLPAGTNYLKVEFKNDGRVYSPALGAITIK